MTRSWCRRILGRICTIFAANNLILYFLSGIVNTSFVGQRPCHAQSLPSATNRLHFTWGIGRIFGRVAEARNPWHPIPFDYSLPWPNATAWPASNNKDCPSCAHRLSIGRCWEVSGRLYRPNWLSSTEFILPCLLRSAFSSWLSSYATCQVLRALSWPRDIPIQGGKSSPWHSRSLSPHVLSQWPPSLGLAPC